MSISPGASAQPSWYPITPKLTASICQASAAHTGVDLTVIHISIHCWCPSISARFGSHDSRRECGGGGLGNDVFPTDHRSLPLLVIAGALRQNRVRHTSEFWLDSMLYIHHHGAMTMNNETADASVVGEITRNCLLTRTRRISRVMTNIYDQALRPHG